MTWELLIFAIAFTAFVWHIVSDRADPPCPLCEARIKHTHERG